MDTPDPKSYLDGVKFFHDTHKVVLHNCAELDRLVTAAEQEGVFASFAAHPEWDDLFTFFTKDAPHHERDEENLLFPLVTSKISRIGFQQPDAPIRFLIEGHEILQKQMIRLVHDWEVFRNMKRDPATLAAAHATHLAEDAAFVALGRELASLYRDHVALEEERVYSIADKALSGEEKLALADSLRAEYDNEAITPIMMYEQGQFTNPQYNAQTTWTEARSDDALEADFEEDD